MLGYAAIPMIPTQQNSVSAEHVEPPHLMTFGNGVAGAVGVGSVVRGGVVPSSAAPASPARAEGLRFSLTASVE